MITVKVMIKFTAALAIIIIFGSNTALFPDSHNYNVRNKTGCSHLHLEV
jgi:hypothetical protein